MPHIARQIHSDLMRIQGFSDPRCFQHQLPASKGRPASRHRPDLHRANAALRQKPVAKPRHAIARCHPSTWPSNARRIPARAGQAPAIASMLHCHLPGRTRPAQKPPSSAARPRFPASIGPAGQARRAPSGAREAQMRAQQRRRDWSCAQPIAAKLNALLPLCLLSPSTCPNSLRQDKERYTCSAM